MSTPPTIPPIPPLPHQTRTPPTANLVPPRTPAPTAIIPPLPSGAGKSAQPLPMPEPATVVIDEPLIYLYHAESDCYFTSTASKWQADASYDAGLCFEMEKADWENLKADQEMVIAMQATATPALPLPAAGAGSVAQGGPVGAGVGAATLAGDRGCGGAVREPAPASGLGAAGDTGAVYVQVSGRAVRAGQSDNHSEGLCEDEGCPNHGMPHVCVTLAPEIVPGSRNPDFTRHAPHPEEKDVNCYRCGDSKFEDVYINGEWVTAACDCTLDVKALVVKTLDDLAAKSLELEEPACPVCGDAGTVDHYTDIGTCVAVRCGCRGGIAGELVDITPFDCPDCEGSGFDSDTSYCRCTTGHAKRAEPVSESVLMFRTEEERAKFSADIDAHNEKAAASWARMAGYQPNAYEPEDDNDDGLDATPEELAQLRAMQAKLGDLGSLVDMHFSKDWMHDYKGRTIAIGNVELPWPWDEEPGQMSPNLFRLPYTYMTQGEALFLHSLAMRSALHGQGNWQHMEIAFLVLMWAGRMELKSRFIETPELQTLKVTCGSGNIRLHELFTETCLNLQDMSARKAVVNMRKIFKYMPSNMQKAYFHAEEAIRSLMQTFNHYMEKQNEVHAVPMTRGRKGELGIVPRGSNETQADYNRRYQREYQRQYRERLKKQDNEQETLAFSDEGKVELAWRSVMTDGSAGRLTYDADEAEVWRQNSLDGEFKVVSIKVQDLG